MSVVPIHAGQPPREDVLGSGTLVWIGETTLPEFRPAYEFCLNHFAQIAPRPSVHQAVCRPASDVRGIVLARNHRLPISADDLTGLRQCYPEAMWVDLLGPLAVGIRQSSHAAARRVAWHRWHPELSACFRIGPAVTAGLSKSGAVRSVLVIASHWDAAEPYLELVDSHRIPAAWSPVGDGQRFRNLDAVWWDDSAAPIADAHQWRRRLSGIDRSASVSPRHVWIAGGVEFEQQQLAMRAGVHDVISKPFRIEALLDMLDVQEPGTRNARVAA